ncbi:hypothetical protein GCM10025857_40070 [Alicyclobacillus contaminans]|nr:hypothetical protein GCM10025857_40070 [Alicyclobacillus contaminans]
MQTVEFQTTKKFVEAFKQATAVAPKKSRIKQILEHVKLSVDGQSVTVEATDLQVYYRRTVKIDGVSTQIPVQTMLHRSAAKTLKPGVRIALAEQTYTVGPVTSLSEDPLAFPSWPLVEGDSVTVDPAYFTALASVAEFADTSEARPVLTTVCHRGHTVVATDGMYLLEAQAGCEFAREIKVPSNVAPTLKKVFGKTGATLTYDDTRALYSHDSTEVVVRLQDGSYPDTSRLFEDGLKVKFYIHDVAPWINALDDVITMYQLSGTDKGQHPVWLRQQNNEVTLSAHGAGTSFSTKLTVSGPAGDWEYTIDATLLRTALAHSTGTVAMRAGEPKKPILLESDGRKALIAPFIVP